MELARRTYATAHPAMNDPWGELTRLSFDELCCPSA
jgi:hypothetical protein